MGFTKLYPLSLFQDDPMVQEVDLLDLRLDHLLLSKNIAQIELSSLRADDIHILQIEILSPIFRNQKGTRFTHLAHPLLHPLYRHLYQMRQRLS